MAKHLQSAARKSAGWAHAIHKVTWRGVVLFAPVASISLLVTRSRSLKVSLSMRGAPRLRRAGSTRLREQHLTNSQSLRVMRTLAPKREGNRFVIVAVTSDRRLCGAFNANILRTAAAIRSPRRTGSRWRDRLERPMIFRRRAWKELTFWTVPVRFRETLMA